MFNFLKKNKKANIIAPMNGKCISISEVQDEAFSQKMLGDGVAIVPSSGKVVSPIDGEVIQVFDTLHAYGLRSNDGIEILIHIGINTVELKGEGFKSFVREGEKVSIGQDLAEVNINLLKERGYLLQTPVIITNVNEIKDMECYSGEVELAKDRIISYNK